MSVMCVLLYGAFVVFSESGICFFFLGGGLFIVYYGG
jgi:hypothetical protein